MSGLSADGVAGVGGEDEPGVVDAVVGVDGVDLACYSFLGEFDGSSLASGDWARCSSVVLWIVPTAKMVITC